MPRELSTPVWNSFWCGIPDERKQAVSLFTQWSLSALQRPYASRRVAPRKERAAEEQVRNPENTPRPQPVALSKNKHPFNPGPEQSKPCPKQNPARTHRPTHKNSHAAVPEAAQHQAARPGHLTAGAPRNPALPTHLQCSCSSRTATQPVPREGRTDFDGVLDGVASATRSAAAICTTQLFSHALCMQSEVQGDVAKSTAAHHCMRHLGILSIFQTMLGACHTRTHKSSRRQYSTEAWAGPEDRHHSRYRMSTGYILLGHVSQIKLSHTDCDLGPTITCMLTARAQP